MTVTMVWPGELGEATFDGETWDSTGPISATTLDAFVPKMSVMISDWPYWHAKDVADAVGAEVTTPAPDSPPTMASDLIMPEDGEDEADDEDTGPIALSRARAGRGVTPARAFERRVMSLSTIPVRLDDAIEAVRDQLLPLLQSLAVESTVATTRALHRPVQQALHDTERYGAAELRLELARQGAAARPATVAPPVDEAAQLLVVALCEDVAAARQEVLRRLRGRQLDQTRHDQLVLTALEHRLSGLASRYGRRVVHSGFALGRAVELAAWAEAPDDRLDLAKKKKRRKRTLVREVVMTAVLDKHTCDECQAVDGEIVEFGSSRYHELMPPFTQCLGGDNCRCSLVGIVSDGNVITIVDDEVVEEDESTDDLDEEEQDDEE